MKKRIFALLLSITLLVSAVVTPVSAESINNFTVKVSDATATAGDSQVAVDILLENNPGIAGFSFCVNYDTEKLVLVESEINIEDGYKVVAQPTGYGVNLAWTGPSGYSENGKIATLYFNVPKDLTASEANVDIVYRAGYDSFYDANENDIVVQTVNGKVAIEALQETDNLSINVGGVSVNFGATDIVVPITVQNNPGFSGFSFCVNYDTSRLVLDSTNIPLEGGYKVIGHPEGYGVNIAWTSTETYTEDGTIAELHFSLKDDPNSGKAYINTVFREGYDSFYSFENGSEQDIAFDSFNGYIDVNNHHFGDWVVTTPATCITTGLKTRTCEDCSKTETVVIPKTDHEYAAVVTPPTCTAQGYTTHTCKTCPDYYIDTYVDMVEHNPGSWEQSIAPECEVKGEEVQKCTVCSTTINTREVDETGHDFDDWYVAIEAKFNEDGQERRDCKNCDHFETKRIPKLSESHVCDYSGAEEVIENATCTVNGSKKVYCTEIECGKFTTVEIVAQGHHFGEWYTTLEPKFNEDGEQRRDCDNCDHFETNRLPMLSESHTCTFTGTEEIVDEPTCTESGSKKVYCSHPDCDKFTTVNVDPKGHTNGTWEVSVEATCTENGTEVIRCTVCHIELQSRSIDSLGHSWDAGVVTKPSDCLNTGEKTFTCTECDATDVRVLPKTGHTSGEWVTTSEPTCDTIGRKELYCTVCLELIGTDTIQTTGHELGKWETVLEPTETVAGRAERSCANCDYVESKDIEPTGVVPKILASSSVGGLGSRVNVTISIADNPGIVSATLTVKYDTNVLTLIEVKDLGNLGTQVHKPQLVSPYTLAWANDTLSENITFNGGLVTLVFEISNNAEIGDYPIEISYNYDNYDIYNMNAEKVKFYTVDGNISIVDVIIGDVNSDGLVNNLDRLTITRFLANWEGYTEETINMVAADVNCDNVVNNLDRMILTRHLANWEGYEFLPYAN